MTTTITDEDGTVRCRTAIDFTSQQYYVMSTIVVFYVIPFVASLILYATICNQLRNSFSKTLVGGDERRVKVSWSQRRQIIIMMFTVAIMFFICLLPFKLISVWTTFDAVLFIKVLGMDGFITIMYVARMMFYLNSTINPIIYSLVSTRFRKYIHPTLVCDKPTQERTGSLLLRTGTRNTTMV